MDVGLCGENDEGAVTSVKPLASDVALWEGVCLYAPAKSGNVSGLSVLRLSRDCIGEIGEADEMPPAGEMGLTPLGVSDPDGGAVSSPNSDCASDAFRGLAPIR